MKRVLVVDDDMDNLFAYKMLLEHVAMEVDTAETIDQAKQCLASSRYDVVITDLRFNSVANEGGFEVFRHARRLWPGCTLIMITAYGDAGIRDRAFDAGASFYFEKPVAFDMLCNALKACKAATTRAGESSDTTKARQDR